MCVRLHIILLDFLVLPSRLAHYCHLLVIVLIKHFLGTCLNYIHLHPFVLLHLLLSSEHHNDSLTYLFRLFIPLHLYHLIVSSQEKPVSTWGDHHSDMQLAFDLLQLHRLKVMELKM